jgi:hypothetical protein
MHNVTRYTKTLLLALALVAPALAGTARAETPAADKAVAKPDLKKVNEHLTQHQTYPATRAQLLVACNELADFSPAEKRWFAAHLSEGTYKSAAEVMAALTRK